VLPFLSYLNSKHSNIQFTHELENNSSLPFLDVNVMRSNGSFTTSVHHKCSTKISKELLMRTTFSTRSDERLLMTCYMYPFKLSSK
jgi:hypothetical protein